MSRQIIGATFCSGIGAPEMATQAPDGTSWVDWRLASEIEPFPRAVLCDRFGYKLPEEHNQGEALLWGDFTEVTPDLLRRRGVPLPDLIVAGTPCQDFSLAGLRAGVSGDRGNLTLKFVELCHAIVDVRPDRKLAVLWENVPGVLSDPKNAFGNFLGGLVGANSALCNPGRDGWPCEGMVEGPRSRVAWRVLDAQYFGLPQRRKRVFVVVDFGGAVDPAKILFEPKGLQGDFAPGREARQDTSPRARRGASHWSGGPHPTLSQSNSSGGIGSSNQEIFSGGSGLVNNALDRAPSEWPGRIASTLNAAFGDKLGLDNQHINSGAPLFVSQAWDLRGREDGAQFEGPSSVSRIRRLMPLECARLQGFPDDHTAIVYKGKSAPDGVRYKAYGNSMAVPCVGWILDRMRKELAP
jgi:site-specific DNA-cytosine methylase